MAAPKVSKLSEDDARGLLASLQRTGEGWYVGLATAINAGAHKSLGMERREFVAQVGQRLIDPHDAIIELHQQGLSQAAIADVLNVDRNKTVNRVLAEEGLVELQLLGSKALEQRSGRAADLDSTAEEVDEEKERLAAQVEELEDELADARGETKRATRDLRDELKQLKDQLKELRKAGLERDRQERKKADDELSPADRRRRHEENEASVDEAMAPVNALAASMNAQAVVGLLEEATEKVTGIIEKGVTAAIISQIAAAHDAFNREFAVAEAMAQEA